ncbi:MAG: S1/P1 nuclease [Acidobacteriia bacterium]|nr:S1/P1 nuclease [Terriglobia bacterium]
MKRHGLLILVLAAAAALFFSPVAQAWGCKGHQTVALLAEKHLTPAAKQMFVALLQNNPVDPKLKRFCGGEAADDFADAATWADDVRTLHPETAPWHFLDIPRGAPRGALTPFCGAAGCVTQAIEQQLAILKDKTAASAQRAEALRFLIHFVGDLHQPLHTTTNGDRGGNCVPIRYFHRIPHLNGSSYEPNLHHLWDTEILERQAAGADPAEIADSLEASFASKIPNWQQARMHLEDWAWEGHQHAEETAYGALAKKIAVEPNVAVNTCADNHNIGARMLHKHIVAGPTYQNQAAAVVEESLAQAGIRLAMILNEAAK